MKIYLGSDHRGAQLAQELLEWHDSDIAFELIGAKDVTPQDDYVDIAQKVAKEVMNETVSADEEALGVLICGSGVGVDIAANKIAGIRSCLGFSVEQVKSARTDDGVNVLSLGADFIAPEKAKSLIKAFAHTRFATEERFVRRIEKLRKLESGSKNQKARE